MTPSFFRFIFLLSGVLFLDLAIVRASSDFSSMWNRESAWDNQESAYLNESGKTKEYQKLFDYLFSEEVPHKTDGALIIKNDRVIFEKYANGYSAENQHLLWSASKSVTHALIGVAVENDDLNLNDSVCRFYNYLAGQFCEITVDHLLTFSTGIEWQELYENDGKYQDSPAIQLLYGDGTSDAPRFIFSQGLAKAPGSYWKYSTGDSTIASGIYHRLYASKSSEIAFNRFFKKIAMHDVTLQKDGLGHFMGASHFYATPRDMARFGRLYLGDGVWNGKRILPEGWVKYARTPAPAFVRGDHERTNDTTGGASFWLNKPVPEIGYGKAWPSAPEDAYTANGHWGQYIFIVPSENLIIVRTGNDRGKGISLDKLYSLASAYAGRDLAGDREGGSEDGRKMDRLPSPTKNKFRTDSPKSYSEEKKKFKTGIFRLVTKYAALEYCLCKYVTEQTKPFCKKWIKNRSATPRIKDKGEGVVRSSLFWWFRAYADYLGPHKGCRLRTGPDNLPLPDQVSHH